MRFLLIVCAVLILLGCRGKNRPDPKAAGRTGASSETVTAGGVAGNNKIVVTAGNTLVGKVALVNTTARFVVLNFPLGRLPTLDQSLNLYRGGLKVGEVKVTGPQYDDNVVADLVAGDSQVGDQVRDK